MQFDFSHAPGVGEDPVNRVLVVDKEGDVKAKICQNRGHTDSMITDEEA
jgi:hypothetical protein